MGGAPLLLALAAVTVDYGWQPDKKGGLEYIIQIPPGQVQQLEATGGEYTSRIDPQVRGLVSRIVVRVGRGPLPREFGNLSPTTNADGSIAMTAGSQQMIETQARELNPDQTIIRGQSGGNAFSMPDATRAPLKKLATEAKNGFNSVAQTANQVIRDVTGSRPSTNFSSTNTAQQNPGVENPSLSQQGYGRYRNAASPTTTQQSNQPQLNNSQIGNAAAPSNGLRSPNLAPNTGSYKEGNWQTAPVPSTTPRTPPSTSYANGVNGATQQNGTGYNQNGYNSQGQGINQNAKQLPSTFANPSFTSGNANTSNGYNFGLGQNIQQSNQAYGQTNPQNTGVINPNQPGYQQGTGLNTYSGNTNLGPMRDAYGTNQQTPNFSGQNTYGNPNITPSYQLAQNGQPVPGMNPNTWQNQVPGYTPIPNAPATSTNGTMLTGLTDSAIIKALLANAKDSDKADDKDKQSTAIVSQQSEQLFQHNRQLAQEKNALESDNMKLIANLRIQEDTLKEQQNALIVKDSRLKGLNFFQFFLMVSFLLNLYLVIHLGKLMQRYREMVVSVRTTSPSVQPV